MQNFQTIASLSIYKLHRKYGNGPLEVQNSYSYEQKYVNAGHYQARSKHPKLKPTTFPFCNVLTFGQHANFFFADPRRVRVNSSQEPATTSAISKTIAHGVDASLKHKHNLLGSLNSVRHGYGPVSPNIPLVRAWR
jgi:hypothetical protein